MKTPFTTRTLSVLMGCLSLLSAQAQKVDLDRYSFDASYLTLPREYVEPDQRTYGVRVNASAAVSSVIPPPAIYDRIQLAGFRKVEANPTVGLVINFGDVRFEKSDLTTRNEEKKEKDGKTSTRTYYAMTIRFSVTGGYDVFGPIENDPRQQRQAEAKAKEIQSNRFLKNASTSFDTPNTRRVSGGFFPNQLNFTTKEFNTAQEATKYLEQNQASIRAELITRYVNDAVVTAGNELNATYGYVPVQTREFLWILDSKSHPEYPIQQEAIKAVKELFKTMRATETTDRLAGDLQPLMDYLQEMKGKYTGSDKRDQKMRYSAFYNLATLYLLLDRPDAAMEEARGLIQNDYDANDGEKLLRQAQTLKAGLMKHRMTSRHMPL